MDEEDAEVAVGFVLMAIVFVFGMLIGIVGC